MLISSIKPNWTLLANTEFCPVLYNKGVVYIHCMYYNKVPQKMCYIRVCVPGIFHLAELFVANQFFVEWRKLSWSLEPATIRHSKHWDCAIMLYNLGVLYMYMYVRSPNKMLPGIVDSGKVLLMHRFFMESSSPVCATATLVLLTSSTFFCPPLHSVKI